MKKMIKTFGIIIVAAAFVPYAFAGETSEKQPSSVQHEGVMTERMGEKVPTMTSDTKPEKESKAPNAATYTDKVGEAVPKMTAPDATKNEK